MLAERFSALTALTRFLADAFTVRRCLGAGRGRFFAPFVAALREVGVLLGERRAATEVDLLRD